MRRSVRSPGLRIVAAGRLPGLTPCGIWPAAPRSQLRDSAGFAPASLKRAALFVMAVGGYSDAARPASPFRREASQQSRRQVTSASLASMREWELCYSRDYRGFSVAVDPNDIVSPASVQRRGPKLEYPDASRDRPIILHREYNWRQPDGTWGRWCAGFSDGIERVARAQHDGIRVLEVVVFGCAFWPPGTRPDDRVRIPTSQVRFVCAAFDSARGAWTELPDDEWGERPTPPVL